MKLLKVGIIVFVMLLCIPRVVHAQQKGQVYFYNRNMNEKGDFTEKELLIEFENNLTTEEKATILFETLFLNEENFTSFIPKDIELIWVCFADGRLILNLSPEAKNCAGNYKEQHFVNQIVKTAYSLKEINSIMLYIDGKEDELPEGTDFSAYNR